MRVKAPRAPAPHTGRVSRRTVISPPLRRRTRAQLEFLSTKWEVDLRGKTVAQVQDLLWAQLEFLATKWDVDPRGKTVAQIRDILYELDKDMREGRRPTQSGER